MCSVGEYSKRDDKPWRAFNTIEQAEADVERLDLEFEKIGRCPTTWQFWKDGDCDRDKWSEAYKLWKENVIAADIGDPEFIGLYGDTPHWWVESCELILESNTPNV
jgi:hypothetical protein